MLLVRDSLKVLDKVDEDGFVLLELALLPEKDDSMVRYSELNLKFSSIYL